MNDQIPPNTDPGDSNQVPGQPTPSTDDALSDLAQPTTAPPTTALPGTGQPGTVQPGLGEQAANPSGEWPGHGGDLQLQQPTPPVYAPPPNFAGQQQYAPPQFEQQAQGQPPLGQPQYEQPQFGQYAPPQQGLPSQYGQPQQLPQGASAFGSPTDQGQPYAQATGPVDPAGQQYGQPPFVPPQLYAQEQYAQGAQLPPGATPPRKKGLPVGAWIGIGAGALVLLLVVALGIWVVVGTARPRVSDPMPLPTTEAPAEEPTEEPESPEPLGVVTLDDTFDLTNGVYWGVPFISDWDVVRFDEQGVNEFSNAAVGCQFLSYQGLGAEGITSADDRGATEETIATALQIGIPWTSATASPEVNSDGSVELPVDYAFSAEFQRFVAKYPTAGGDRQRQMVLRAFMPDNIALYAEVDCPATAEGDAAAQEMLDGLTLTQY